MTVTKTGCCGTSAANNISPEWKFFEENNNYEWNISKLEDYIVKICKLISEMDTLYKYCTVGSHEMPARMKYILSYRRR